VSSLFRKAGVQAIQAANDSNLRDTGPTSLPLPMTALADDLTAMPCKSSAATGHKQAFDGAAAFNDRSWLDTSHSPSLLVCLEVVG
jgi:hypothetical protein